MIPIKHLDEYLKIEECEIRSLYRIRSRNLIVGVYVGNNAFVGIREKFGEKYLFAEYHWDSESFATVKPIKKIGSVPDHISLLIDLGSKDLNTGRLVAFDKPVSDGGKGWYFIDTGEPSKDIRSVRISNKELFDYLSIIENNIDDSEQI